MLPRDVADEHYNRIRVVDADGTLQTVFAESALSGGS
jgi:hypothetical protein